MSLDIGINAGVDSLPMIQRPTIIDKAIYTLLSQGTVADLMTDQGQLLQSLMTPGEECACRMLPMLECPGFDGQTCNYCRGRVRFSHCPECQGTFDPSRHALREG